MRLKRLELLGYKTFATRTEFLFDGQITAIVGPNGSGKSNVADAIRWVLGEQSYSLLRARKSEDMIFSGSERRARMGMAEVTITLDNNEGWLPVEFSEVTITRRSYRSGENEYLLNGSRVRLRDITDLLGKSGLSRRTYTVIGQGLIDVALSLRPQERRKLIEEAAGLTLYHSRRADALNKLEETRRNLLRVHDLIAELSPQVERLRRQAERTREHATLQARLNEALQVWYGHRWQQGQQELHRLREAARYCQERLESLRAQGKELDAQLASIRARQGELRRQLSEWHRQSSELHAHAEKLERERAVAEERRRQLSRRRQELLTEISSLDKSRSVQEEQVATVKTELAAIAGELERYQGLIAEAKAALATARQAMAGLQTARDKAQRELLALRSHAADLQSRLSRLDERERELKREEQTRATACRALEKELADRRDELAALVTRLHTNTTALDDIDTQRARRERELTNLQEQRQSLRERRHELAQRLGRLRERYDVLTRMHQEGAGLYEGVRNVLLAGEQLTGIVGTVAGLICVPRELETAIEVALGGRLQDIVVESWTAAQEAIAYLKRTRGGRATFLPLDTLRPPSLLHPPQTPGVVGLGSELVEYPPRLRPVAEYLLGRTLVCRDLHVARRVLNELRGSYQIVTTDGELVRSSGAITGGTGRRGRSSGMLARERERRELPERIGKLESHLEEVKQELSRTAAQETRVRDELATLAARHSRLENERRELERAEARLQQQVERIERELEWHGARTEKARRELSGLAERGRELHQELHNVQARIAAAEEELAAIESRLTQADDRELDERLADLRTEEASLRRRQAAKEAELAGYRRSRQQLDAQIADRRRRIRELDSQIEQAERQLARVKEKEEALAVRIRACNERIAPAERELAELENRQAQVEKETVHLRVRIREAEARYNQAGLQVARQEDELRHLKQQIEKDLGPVELEMGEDLNGQPFLPLQPLVSPLPTVESLPEGLEEEIATLKRRIRRIGAVNPDAPAEYRDMARRHEFLTTQARDLEQAIAHLEKVIAELDEVMKREFKRTFQAIAREFKSQFTRLFEGGSARLQLTDPDDLMSTGIEIVARPPGKRQQGLALLSGGERALTAAALIFAILSVSPTPFCVLDEVDAALDEANVGRFRAVLRELAAQTQFVVITHNRYTIEIADLVYGISMGEDGISCVISRRMQDA